MHRTTVAAAAPARGAAETRWDVGRPAGSAGAVAGRPLPEAAVRALREAFADELAERLPRLRAAAAEPAPAAEVLAQAERDAHTLASSAAMLGEPAAAAAARALEEALAAGRTRRLHPLAADLDRLLGGWRP